MEEFKKFLLEGNPYAIDIVLNLIDSQMEKESLNNNYFNYLKDLADKFIKIKSEGGDYY
ncbi:hypothetical protein [uncultured Clostridium sp.]|uniref:hypothetical protein n=1 Tax=uncultured Clostridium sp. TaxID=59620 RepID=UPI0025D8FFC8|nr:hypothetical protein [uncultured Clostridium sp.]